MSTAKKEAAESPVRGRQRKGAHGLQPVPLHLSCETREAQFAFQSSQKHGLLRAIDKMGQRLTILATSRTSLAALAGRIEVLIDVVCRLVKLRYGGDANHLPDFLNEVLKQVLCVLAAA